MGTGPAQPRFGGMKAGYESYYLRAAAPGGGRGFWLRHTVRVAPREEPSGSLWLTWFDAENGPTATKLTLAAPEEGGDPIGSWLVLGGASVGEERATGAIGDLPGRVEARWDLDFIGEPPLEHLAKPWLYSSPLPRTKPVSLHPIARFTGTVSVGGQEHVIDHWPGMVGHNWGKQHAERWIWLHGMIFDSHDDDTWIDVVLGQIRVGPVLLPWVASGAISLAGERLELGGLGRTRATDVDERPTGARVTLPGADGLVVGVEVGAPKDRFVAWGYADPDGRTHDVANCSIADMTARVERPGRPALTLRARGTAAYELGMRERNHGIPLQPFADGPVLRPGPVTS